VHGCERPQARLGAHRRAGQGRVSEERGAQLGQDRRGHDPIATEAVECRREPGDVVLARAQRRIVEVRHVQDARPVQEIPGPEVGVLEHELLAGIRRGAKPVAHVLVNTTSEPGGQTALAPLGEPLAQLRPVPMGDLLRRRQRDVHRDR
jgi:hypothetical protein